MTFKYRLSSWVLFALAARMYGADPTGAISGTVLDPSGAAVTKVRITATNTGASLNRETLSAVEGGFIFPLPPVGPYALAMEAPGFRSFEQRDRTLVLWGQPEAMAGDELHRIVQLGLRRASVERMDAADLRFEDGSFDAILAPYVMSVVNETLPPLTKGDVPCAVRCSP